jgi:hypothetical protein
VTSPEIEVLDKVSAPLSLDDFSVLLERARSRAAPCFSAECLATIERISADLLRAGASNLSPALLHFAFWTRRAALTRLEQDWRRTLPRDCRARPVGLVFHVPPQNVETVFLYSWVVSYLLGNANVVRLPGTVSPELERFVDLLVDNLPADGPGQFFVRYAVSDDVARTLSSVSDARIVWGGNAKIDAYAPLPLRAGGKSLWFGDRRSFAILNQSALDGLDPDGISTLADQMARDILPFDQLACSSPQTLVVLGSSDESDALRKVLD